MKKLLVSFFVVGLFAVIMTTSALADSDETESTRQVVGTVSDSETHNAIAGATITVNDDGEIETFSDEYGRYILFVSQYNNRTVVAQKEPYVGQAKPAAEVVTFELSLSTPNEGFRWKRILNALKSVISVVEEIIGIVD